MSTYVKHFLQDEQGQDLVEYTLLLAFIALAGITVISSIRTSLTSIWGKVNTSMSTADAAATAAK